MKKNFFKKYNLIKQLKEPLYPEEMFMIALDF